MASELLAVVTGIARMAGQPFTRATVVLSVVSLLVDLVATVLTWAVLQYLRDRQTSGKETS